MKYCSICGAPHEDDAEFCTNCGMKLTECAEQNYVSPKVNENKKEEEPYYGKQEQEVASEELFSGQADVKKPLVSNKMLILILVVLGAAAIVFLIVTSGVGGSHSSAAMPETEYADGTQGVISDYEGEAAQAADNEAEPTAAVQGNDSLEPFYGIWCAAYLTEEDAESLVQAMQAQGLLGEVIITSEWGNLNPTRYYVVTAGRYYSESEANAELDRVSFYYPDAYVKFTGAWLAS